MQGYLKTISHSTKYYNWYPLLLFAAAGEIRFLPKLKIQSSGVCVCATQCMHHTRSYFSPWGHNWFVWQSHTHIHRLKCVFLFLDIFPLKNKTCFLFFRQKEALYATTTDCVPLGRGWEIKSFHSHVPPTTDTMVLYTDFSFHYTVPTIHECGTTTHTYLNSASPPGVLVA